MNKPQLIAQRFRINDLDQDLLGRGAMGDVYRAIDTQTGEPVAIKALKPEMMSGEGLDAMRRFVREGEALRQLNHPNIVKMLAAVEEAGRHYLVMEYVGGGSLRDWLERQTEWPVARVVDLALDLADALTRAHRLNIIHRDLKPDNVMLAGDGSARLTDFGVAHFGNETNLTATGAVIGTFAYLSPEACMGEPVNEGADIWAFGIMLYELLAGERPFKGNNPAVVLTAILTQPIPDLALFRPEAPEALLDLIYRMLDKNPTSRIPSVRLVGAELEALRKGIPLVLPPGNDHPAGEMGRPATSSIFTTPTAERRDYLPAQTMPFVGRQAAVAEVTTLLADEDCRLITLLGPGGIGKSRLAIELASRQLAVYPHGVYFVALAALNSADLLVSAIATTLKFSFLGSRSPREQLLDYLRDKHLLLLLDSFEQVLPAAAFIAELLDTAPALKVLVTSRSRLNLQAECLYEVTEMSFPAHEEVASLETYEAVQMFVAYARRTQPGYQLTPADGPAVARICQLVQGLPLGLELAAAWVRMLSPLEIAAELEGNLDFLETSTRDVAERHRSMRAAFDYSWRLLSADEQAIFKKLAIFRGGFTREAAKQVTGASLLALIHLVDQSLLRRQPTGRYEMQALIRQYALEKLAAEAQEQTLIQDLHCAYYAAFLGRQETYMKQGGRGLEETLHEIEVEIGNLRAGWQWAVAQGQTDVFEAFAFALYLFYEVRGWYQEFVELIQAAVDRLEQAPLDPAKNIIVGKLIALQGAAAARLNRIAEAMALGERSLVLLDQPDSRQERGLALTLLSVTCYLGADYPAVMRLAAEALPLHREFDNLWGAAISLSMLGSASSALGQPAQARQFLQESVALTKKLNSRYATGRNLVNLGQALSALGAYQEAREHYEEALATTQRLGDHFFIVAALAGLGEVSQALGDDPAAARYFREALQAAAEHKIILFSLIALTGLAMLKAKAGQADQAVEILTLVLNQPAALGLVQAKARPPLAELQARLSPAAFAAAQARGEALQLETVIAEMLQR